MDKSKRPTVKIGMFSYFCCICDLFLIRTDEDVEYVYDSIDDWFDDYGDYEKIRLFDSWDDVLNHFKGYESDEEIEAQRVRIFGE